jgi:hypothetical protein
MKFLDIKAFQWLPTYFFFSAVGFGVMACPKAECIIKKEAEHKDLENPQSVQKRAKT